MSAQKRDWALLGLMIGLLYGLITNPLALGILFLIILIILIVAVAVVYTIAMTYWFIAFPVFVAILYFAIADARDKRKFLKKGEPTND